MPVQSQPKSNLSDALTIVDNDEDGAYPSIQGCLFDFLRGFHYDKRYINSSASLWLRICYSQGKALYATSCAYDPSIEQQDQSPDTVLEIDKSFLRLYRDELEVQVAEKFTAKSISHEVDEGEVYGWSPMKQKRRDEIAARCAQEVKEFFAQLD